MALYAITAVFVAILVVARARFARYRRGRPDYPEWKVAKSRLPTWVRAVEALILLAFLFACAVTLGFMLVVIGVIARVPPPTGDGINLLVPLTCFVASFGPAALLANLVSMLVPALRRANERAFADLPTASVRLANKNLWRMSAVLIPYGLFFAILGYFLPGTS